ncbi:MAG: RNA polymerase sigma factor [Saprospiraceae bacterium]|nr:RNA polymerase sigma factor [Saprospiraceae bacterium]
MNTTLSDEQLMIRLQGGDTATLEVLYHRYAERLMGFLYRMVDGDRTKAEDLLQDVFVRLATTAKAFDPARSFRPWVFTIAANLARNAHRHRSYREMEGFPYVETELAMSTSISEIDQLDQDLFHNVLDHSLQAIAPDKRTAFYFATRSISRWQKSLKFNIAQSVRSSRASFTPFGFCNRK